MLSDERSGLRGNRVADLWRQVIGRSCSRGWEVLDLSGHQRLQGVGRRMGLRDDIISHDRIVGQTSLILLSYGPKSLRKSQQDSKDFRLPKEGLR